MKRVTMLSTLTAAMLLPGCSGAYWGNLIVLGISAGIFFGTLSLGRTSASETARSRADSSSNSKLG